jgi:DNA-binding MarR family transcriptional regulator
MLSKFLPVSDLNVEEVIEKPVVKQSIVEKILIENKKKHKQVEHFKHPSGRTLQDFILEYINNNPKYPANWKDIGKHAESLGFHKSSINNGITRLLKAGLIQKVSPGKYKLHDK